MANSAGCGWQAQSEGSAMVRRARLSLNSSRGDQSLSPLRWVIQPDSAIYSMQSNGSSPSIRRFPPRAAPRTWGGCIAEARLGKILPCFPPPPLSSSHLIHIMVVQLSDFTAHHNPLILTTSHQFLSLMISPTLTIVESKRMLHALRLVGHMWFQDEYATVFAVYKEPAAAVEAARLELIRIKRALGSLVKLPADRLAAYRNVKDERHFLGLCGVIPAETASPLMTVSFGAIFSDLGVPLTPSPT